MSSRSGLRVCAVDPDTKAIMTRCNHFARRHVTCAVTAALLHALFSTTSSVACSVCRVIEYLTADYIHRHAIAKRGILYTLFSEDVQCIDAFCHP